MQDGTPSVDVLEEQIRKSVQKIVRREILILCDRAWSVGGYDTIL